MSHIILLWQPTNDKTSSTYEQFTSLSHAMKSVLNRFETRLFAKHSNKTNVNYTVKDVYKYIDHLADFAALVLDNKSKTYMPRDKTWIKERLLEHIQRTNK